jgi:hypothetical protein
MRRFLLAPSFFAMLLPTTAESQQPWFFAVLADPVYNVAGNTVLEMFRPLKLYDAPNSTVASPTFGQILGGSNNRVLQLGVRISY